MSDNVTGKQADVVVLGAGIVGVSAAFAARQRGLSVVLVDRREPGSETSYGNAGVLSSGSILPLNKPSLWSALPGYLGNTNAALRWDIHWAMRNIDWIEENLRKVDKLSDGKVAYVYMPNTGGAGYTNFNRYFYSQLNKKALVLDESGKEVTLLMGCYGIGVTRIVAAAIEQNHDERGIIWPAPIAPFQVVLIPLNLQKSSRVRELTDQLYAEFSAAGIEVLCDDRDARPGVKFADAELLGIPHRLVIAERGLDAGRLEYRGRRDSESTEFPLADALQFIRARLQG